MEYKPIPVAQRPQRGSGMCPLWWNRVGAGVEEVEECVLHLLASHSTPGAEVTQVLRRLGPRVSGAGLPADLGEGQ